MKYSYPGPRPIFAVKLIEIVLVFPLKECTLKNSKKFSLPLFYDKP